ncbi:MAG: DNA-binding domain-containing protein [Rhodospirillales bacterium]
MWHDRQQGWSDGLLNPQVVPVGIASDRFAIHRNNFALSLIELLRGTFPVVSALLGEDCFNTMARQFIRRDPPRSPVLIEYGRTFGRFLEAHELSDEVPYIADVARLEWARHEAFHAADTEPAGIAALAGIPADDLDELHLRVHPSVRLVYSRWPAVSIWHAHQEKGTPEALANLPAIAETALVVRPALDVEVRIIADQAAAFLAAVMKGNPLGRAIGAAMAEGPGDIAACLDGAFSSGAIAGIDFQSHEPGGR